MHARFVFPLFSINAGASDGDVFDLAVATGDIHPIPQPFGDFANPPSCNIRCCLSLELQSSRSQ